MLDEPLYFIDEDFYVENVSPERLDELLARGWRNFGTYFFRYSLGIHDGMIMRVMPLRIRLDGFSLSKSQRRVLRRNSDLTTTQTPIAVDEAAIELFHRHKQRFRSDPPTALTNFTGEGVPPCEMRELRVFDRDELYAVSYFAVGARCISGVYAMHEPEHTRRSLGILTMLKEIEIAQTEGKQFYYLGYAYSGSSFYDYKKRFRGTEMFDWGTEEWLPFAE